MPKNGETARGPRRALSTVPPDPFELVVAASLDAPGIAREAITRWLSGRVVSELLDDVRLVITEIVTNSVRHAGVRRGDVVRITAEVADDRVRLEVEDPGRGGRVVRRPARLERAGGFGLNIVEALALRWGVSGGEATCVWAELRAPGV